MEKKKDPQNEEISIDWFEDHESSDKDEEPEELIEEDLEDTIFEDNKEFNRKVGHFLSNQRKDVSLEKMLELPENNLENSLPKKEEDNKPPESNFDYLVKSEEEQIKYKSVEPESHFVRPDVSSTERILEEQKQIYKHISAPGHMIGENKNEMMTVRPEDTIKKDYLTKKKFKTGPY